MDPSLIFIQRLTESIENRHQESKTPEMSVKDFNGDYTKWSSWWDSFYAMIDKKKIEDVQKMHQMTILLKGEAAWVLAGMPLTSQSYEIVVRRLKDKYGNMRLMLYTLLREVMRHPQYARMNQFGEATMFLRGQYTRLVLHGVDFTNPWVNLYTMVIFTSKIPAEILDKWELKHGTREDELNSTFPDGPRSAAMLPLRLHVTVEDFLKFCEVRVKAKESSARTQGSKGGDAAAHNDNSQGGRNRGGKGGRGGGHEAAPAQVLAAATGPPAKKKKSKQKAANGLAAAAAPPSNCNAGGAAPGGRSAQAPPANPIQHHDAGCVWCGQGHSAGSCNKVNKYSVPERWLRIRHRHAKTNEDLCFCCFEAHRADTCSKPLCGKNGCDRRHSQLLCKSTSN